MSASQRWESIWYTNPSELFQSIKGVGTGSYPVGHPAMVLETALLVSNGKLTPIGQEIYRELWVRNNQTEAQAILAEALRPALPFQVLQQELRGYPAINEEGALNLLHLHRSVPDNLELVEFRKLLIWANELGLLVYSKKHKSIRASLPPQDTEPVGNDPRLAAVISPRTPMSNIVRLRQVLRSMAGVVWWAEPHLSRRILEDLIEELDFTRVTEVRLLSGNSPDILNDKAKNDFSRFKEEAERKGVTVSWRADSNRDWHDRYLVDDRVSYNLPPANTLYKGDYSEILPTEKRPPLEEWWKRSSNAW